MATGTEARTILIIEDEPNIMKFAARVLELEGYQILEACTAAEGLAATEKAGIDLILLDLMLPGTDGWEVLSQLKNDAHVSTIPVVVFSAAVERSNRERAFNMGVVDFLMKPLSSSKLKETIRDTLKQRNI